LEEAVPETDVLYMTRIQKERFDSDEEYNKVHQVRILHQYYKTSMVDNHRQHHFWLGSATRNLQNG